MSKTLSHLLLMFKICYKTRTKYKQPLFLRLPISFRRLCLGIEHLQILVECVNLFT